jgi:hypothetical protein
MALDWLLEDTPAYISRGQRILSVLDGSGTIDVLPGRPDVKAEPSDFEKGEKFNPDIDFDPNSFSRMDKFDGLEVGQELIDSQLDKSKPASNSINPEEK